MTEEYFLLDWNAKPTIVGHVVDSSTTALANRWTKGAVINLSQEAKNIYVKVDTQPEDEYPDYFTLQQIPIVSQDFIQALSGAGIDNFDIYPIPIVEPKRTIEGYCILNVVGRVACLDMDLSKVTYIDEDIDVIFRMKKMVIDTSKTHSLSMFRVHEFELAILVAERIKNALVGLKGVTLLPANGWSDSVWF